MSSTLNLGVDIFCERNPWHLIQYTLLVPVLLIIFHHDLNFIVNWFYHNSIPVCYIITKFCTCQCSTTHVMHNISLWPDHQNLHQNKIKFLLNVEFEWKFFNEMIFSWLIAIVLVVCGLGEIDFTICLNNSSRSKQNGYHITGNIYSAFSWTCWKKMTVF